MPNLSRRDFLKGALATAATAVVGSSLPVTAFADSSNGEAAVPTVAVPAQLNPQDYNIAECSIEDFSTSAFLSPGSSAP